MATPLLSYDEAAIFGFDAGDAIHEINLANYRITRSHLTRCRKFRAGRATLEI
jgi:hypothetical protein